ncbi:MAG: T9SS type A sorting domain-containing protein [Bacteroidota bacterium]
MKKYFYLGLILIISNTYLWAQAITFDIVNKVITATDDNFECNALLPIELLDFQATAQDNYTTLLTWQTITEQNNEYFTLERSVDGKAFIALQKMPGAGFSNGELHYQTIDPNPQIGINYYRLRQTDFDGSSSLSEIQLAVFNAKDLRELSIYPNPAREQVQVTIPVVFKTGTLDIFDTNGRLIRTQPLTSGASQITVSVRDIQAGTYLLRFTLDEEYLVKLLTVTH